MKKWLLKNAFWLLAVTSSALSFVAISYDNMLALLAFFTMMVLSLCAGVYYANVEFTKELLTEYDNLVRVQGRRRGLKVIKGGKRNEMSSNPQPPTV